MDGEWLLELFEMAWFMGKCQIGLGFWSQLSVSWLDRCAIARILAWNLIFLEYHLWLERRLNLKFKFFKKSKLMTLVTRCTRSSFPVLIPLLRDGSATCSNFTHFSHTNRNFPTHAVTPFQKTTPAQWQNPKQQSFIWKLRYHHRRVLQPVHLFAIPLLRPAVWSDHYWLAPTLSHAIRPRGFLARDFNQTATTATTGFGEGVIIPKFGCHKCRARWDVYSFTSSISSGLCVINCLWNINTPSGTAAQMSLFFLRSWVNGKQEKTKGYGLRVGWPSNWASLRN